MWWRQLGEVEIECTSHNFSLFVIFLPKIIKTMEIWRISDKNNFAQFFETRCSFTQSVILPKIIKIGGNLTKF